MTTRCRLRAVRAEAALVASPAACARILADAMSICSWDAARDPWSSTLGDSGQAKRIRASPLVDGTAVCEFVKNGRYDGDTNIVPYDLLPLSVRMRTINASEWLLGGAPRDLGRHHARLPVVHSSAGRKNRRNERGIWFYFASGCSDMYYDVGRTLAARNKVHAALLLAQLLDGVGASRAADHLSSWLLSDPMNASKHRGTGLSAAMYLDAIAASGRSLAHHLCSAANGMVGPQSFASQPDWGRRCKVNETERCHVPALQRLLVCVTTFEFLDDFIALAARKVGIDSVQLVLQPSAADVNRNDGKGMLLGRKGVQAIGREPRWSVEILDVRSYSENILTYAIEDNPQAHLLPHLVTAHGQQCRPTCFFSCCMSCTEAPMATRGCIEQPIDAFVQRTTSNPATSPRCVHTCSKAEKADYFARQRALPLHASATLGMGAVHVLNGSAGALPCCKHEIKLEPGRAGRCAWQFRQGNCSLNARVVMLCPVACGACAVCQGHPQHQFYQWLAKQDSGPPQQQVRPGSKRKVKLKGMLPLRTSRDASTSSGRPRVASRSANA